MPPDVGRGWPRFKGTSPSKPDAEVWFQKDVLENEEWMRDPTGKARRVALEVLDEFRRKDQGSR